jgi:hypothetical protein
MTVIPMPTDVRPSAGFKNKRGRDSFALGISHDDFNSSPPVYSPAAVDSGPDRNDLPVPI